APVPVPVPGNVTVLVTQSSVPLPHRSALLRERAGALQLLLRSRTAPPRPEPPVRDAAHRLGEGQPLALPPHLLDRREHQRRPLGRRAATPAPGPPARGAGAPRSPGPSGAPQRRTGEVLRRG